MAGLKFGMYSDAGEKTCMGLPGSRGFEPVDATSFAEWGIDYLKYDKYGPCFPCMITQKPCIPKLVT
jgi:hypothetical protein